METLPIPSLLAEVAGRDHMRELREWVAGLPGIVAGLAERWGLIVGEPYEPGGQCSWVAPVRAADGAELVLKVGWRHTEAEHEADALRLWDGHGAVRLHAAYAFDHTCALLVERCRPGTPLGHTMAEAEQDTVVAGLLRRVRRAPPGGHRFRPLRQMCEKWADEFEAGLARIPAASIPGWPRRRWPCSGRCRTLRTTLCCCARTCTRGTFWRHGGSAGWWSTRNPTSAIPRL